MIHTLFDEGFGGVCLFLSVIYEGFQKRWYSQIISIHHFIFGLSIMNLLWGTMVPPFQEISKNDMCLTTAAAEKNASRVECSCWDRQFNLIRQKNGGFAAKYGDFQSFSNQKCCFNMVDELCKIVILTEKTCDQSQPTH